MSQNVSGPGLEASRLDVGAAYRALRIRVQGLVTFLRPEEWEHIVPHCPEWTVRQTLAHLCGVVDDGINNNMVGVTTPPWTQAQVEKRAEKTGPEIAEEWAMYAPFVEARATQEGMRLAQLVFDALTHEHDLRHALAQPGERDSSAFAVATGFLAGRFDARNGGAPIQIMLNGNPLLKETDTDRPTLSATPFDVVRTFASRRTRAQILALDWSSDPSQVLNSLVPFGFPTKALNE